MHSKIISENPFVVRLKLYNMLGEVDGHPVAVVNLDTGAYTLTHDTTYGSLIAMADCPNKGDKIPDNVAQTPHVWAAIEERLSRTGFYRDPQKTITKNRFYRGSPEWPSYLFVTD